jgi:hypothetical protein
MDKKDDGHTSTITNTTNIKNDLDFIFKQSHCFSHLQCKHLDYHWLLCLGSKNKIEWYGLFISQLHLGDGPLLKSTLACNYCKRVHVCKYMWCSHLLCPSNKGHHSSLHPIGTHAHPVGKMAYREIVEIIKQLIRVGWCKHQMPNIQQFK